MGYILAVVTPGVPILIVLQTAFTYLSYPTKPKPILYDI